MAFVDKAQDKIEEALNAEGRSSRHVALGLLLCLAAVGATAAIAAIKPQPAVPGAPRQPRASLGRAIWPALFSVTTLAAIRVWNAPSSPQRTRALGLWGGLQGINALWMLLRPKDRVTQTAAALSTAAMTGLYARAAAHVDEKAASLVGPAGWASLGGAFTRQRLPTQPAMH
jgi:tryptophan-rich sensory protein